MSTIYLGRKDWQDQRRQKYMHQGIPVLIIGTIAFFKGVDPPDNFVQVAICAANVFKIIPSAVEPWSEEGLVILG